MKRIMITLGFLIALAAPAGAKGGELSEHEDFGAGWTVEREGDRLIAERSIQRVAGKDRSLRVSVKSLNTAVRAAIVNNAFLDAKRVTFKVDHGTVILRGRVQDKATAMRTMAAISQIPYLERIESRLSY